MSILLFSKRRDDFYFQKALDFIKLNSSDVVLVQGLPGEPFPKEYLSWDGDYIISYLCPWVLPDAVLKKAKKAAINFHPGPPQYPGTGCTNFAIYHEVEEYGVTCHYMVPQVDSGNIIAVTRFPVFLTDTVYSLTQRCYAHMLALFYDVFSKILKDEPLPVTDETWTRKPYRRKDLNALKRIELDMSPEEIRRRIRASAYPNSSGAYVEIAGQRFEYTPERE